MDIDSLLIVHEQDSDKRPAVEQVRAMRAAITGTVNMRYDRDKTKELTANITASATKAGADDLLARLAERARDDADTIKARDDDERERLANANGHSVDPRRFTAAATAGEISSLLRDAEAIDADTLKRAWGFAQPALKALAAKEAREYRQPGAASAFNAWTVWQARMASVTQRAPDRAVLTDRTARRQRELKEKVLSVWRVVGLDQMVARHLVAADIQEQTPTGGAPAKNTLTVGRWFDQFGSTRK